MTLRKFAGVSRRVVFIVAAVALATAVSPLQAEVTQTQETIRPGIALIRIIDTDTPRAIYVVRIDRKQHDLTFRTCLAQGKICGLERLTDQAKRLEKEGFAPYAGVNGDFFIISKGPYQGDPIGLHIMRGGLVSFPFYRSVLLFHGAKVPEIVIAKSASTVERPDGKSYPLAGLNQERGKDKIVLYTNRFDGSTRANKYGTEAIIRPFPKDPKVGKTYVAKVIEIQKAKGDAKIPRGGAVLSGHDKAGAFLSKLKVGDEVKVCIKIEKVKTDVAEAIGGTPRLLRGGKISVEWKKERTIKAFATTRHPRTAFGWNAGYTFMVVVDGRQLGYSAGISLADLAKFMLQLGCKEAMNLDGGGSSELWAKGKIVNRPSDGHERPLANSLFIVSKGARKSQK